jgi:hypothetical protein
MSVDGYCVRPGWWNIGGYQVHLLEGNYQGKRHWNVSCYVPARRSRAVVYQARTLKECRRWIEAHELSPEDFEAEATL